MEVKRILFPTDFSENTEKALPFLLHMAQKTNSEILFFHAFRKPEMVVDLPYEAIQDEVKMVEKSVLKQLNALIDKARGIDKNVKTACVARAGTFIAELKEVVDDYRVDVLIMTSKGVEGVSSGIFGTHAAHVIESVNIPVIVIPQQTPFKTVKNIVFASEYHEYDIEAIQFLSVVASLFDAELTVVNVYSENLIMERLRTNEFQDMVREEVIYPLMHFKYLKGDDVFAAIEKYVEENNIDLIAMTTRHRKLFEKIFQNSLTKKLAEHGKTPIMAFHAVE